MTPCPHGSQHCYRVGDKHHKKFSHDGRKSQTTCRLFHGTRYENADSILRDGLRESSEGRLGKGVYFTTKKWAHRIAAQKGNGTKICVIEVEVDLGNLKKLDGQEEDRTGNWSRHSPHHISCRTMHPPWSAVTQKQFLEICVRNSKRCKIVGMTAIGKVTANGTIEHFNRALAISPDGSAHAEAQVSFVSFWVFLQFSIREIKIWL